MTKEDSAIVNEPALACVGSVTKSRTIGIIAPPSLLSSNTYADLKRRWTAGLTVIEPDCHNWSLLIEKDMSQHIDLDSIIGEMMRWQTDVIILADSGYSSLKRRIEILAGPTARILEIYSPAV